MNTVSVLQHLVLSGLALIGLFGFPAHAAADPTLALRFPGTAEVTASLDQPMASIRLPIGPFENGKLTTTLAEGMIEQTAWRMAASGLSTLELMQTLRDQIEGAGYAVLFECETTACGGFDFRYGIDLLPEPDMHVDLGDFRYLAAGRDGPKGPEFVNLIVSASAQDAFVQMTRVGRGSATASDQTEPALADAPVRTTAPVSPDAGGVPTDWIKGLELGGSMALDDLVFPSGSSALLEGDYASLQELAVWLRANPDKRVTLVGHTDASGNLASNVALSRQRAESVRKTLVAQFDIAASRIDAEGVGYLSPRDSNLTDAGMQRNRRVEVLVNASP